MLNRIYEFVQKPIVWINLIIAVFINLLAWILIFINIQPGDKLIVLHYTYNFGVDLVGKWSEVPLIPLLGIVILFINFVLSEVISKRNMVFSNFLVVLSSVVQLFIFLSIIFIILANRPAAV